jgi:hypothetical protein
VGVNSSSMDWQTERLVVNASSIRARPRQSTGEIPFLKPALLLQGAHVIEHVLLTGTYLAIGEPIGFTTLFGLGDGAFGSGLRVWAHFLLNLVATYFAVRAVLEMRRRGLLAIDGHLEGPVGLPVSL